MKNLIDELRREHSIIIDVLSEVEKKGCGSKEGQESLNQAKQTLLTHLKKEDELFYPVLKEAAKKDSALQQSLSFFASDMEAISDYVSKFFDEQSQSAQSGSSGSGCGVIISLLSNRVEREERILFPAYNKVKGASEEGK